jgi:hypothetical protein
VDFALDSARALEVELQHLTSAAAGVPNGGYSPVDLIVNDVDGDPFNETNLLLNNYDVAQQHGGSHGFETDTFAIPADLLRAGTNSVSIAFYSTALTNYWFRHLEIRAVPGDDAYENNNNKTVVDARVTGQENSPNLGVVQGVRVIPGLAMVQDREDWFRFEIDGPGRRGDHASIRFAEDAGDLELDLLNASGELITSGQPTDSGRQVSLHGLPTGAYYLRVHPRPGAANPNYSLRVQTNTPDHRLLSAPYTSDFPYRLSYEISGERFTDLHDLAMGLNEITLTCPSSGSDPL